MLEPLQLPQAAPIPHRIMRTKAWTIALVILCAANVHAQEWKGSLPTHTKEHGCMSMSDSTSSILGLTAAQFAQVKESDARCTRACELMDDGAMGSMDDGALAAHKADMERIMTTEQFAKWSAMCNTSKADNKTSSPPQN